MGGENSDPASGLFGWVPAEQRGQGRPPFAWTREKSNKIMVLFASNLRQRDVARIIGCDVKTLRKVFPQEVRHAADAELLIRSGMMARLMDGAEAGNTAAIRQLDKMLAAERVKQASRNIIADRKERAPVLGKKESRKVAAKEMEGRFRTRTPPPALLQ